MGRESLADVRNARGLYEIDVRTGAYGDRRWVIMPVAVFVLVLLAATGMYVRNLVSGYWYLLGIFAVATLLLAIPVLVRRMKRE